MISTQTNFHAIAIAIPLAYFLADLTIDKIARVTVIWHEKTMLTYAHKIHPFTLLHLLCKPYCTGSVNCIGFPIICCTIS